ncbi:MAG TPA: alpha/beta hydrolase [Kofleriaceae bacterium]|nr:alpha/beta hydrolase [Kofleriaceae bacterium]
MKVLHFGPGNRSLLGTLHAPQRLRPRSAAVLLCNPFGEEAARAHRIYRVLATQLVRQGYAVLRFDYGGTGDSMGDSAEAAIAGWIADVEVAADELRAATGGARRVVAIGLRLGGTLAALASSRGGLRLRHLILWDPIVDGRAYLQELDTMHRTYMRQELGEHAWHDLRPAAPGGVPSEALGTPIGRTLAAELGALDLTAEDLRTDHVTVISTRTTPSMARLRQRLPEPPAAKWIDLPASPAWNSDAALNAAVVPMDIVETVVAQVEAVSP